ncbi:hypothetical protein D3C75_966960 [compost metagenome]
MSKVMQQLEVVDYCGNPECQAEIMFGQKAIRYGQELLCSNECLCSRIGAVVIKAENENDPMG